MKQIPNLNASRDCTPDRRGSTLLIVVALLGMLAFLGFVFYTLAAQERANAVSYSQGAKITKAPALEPDAMFDFALQQIILGPSDSYTQSILWGGRHSLLANMFGRDGIPWNGEGVNLMSVSGQPQVDMNLDGVPEADNFLNFVDSGAANNGTPWGVVGAMAGMPAPDVNYNSPDINSVFLSYDGICFDGTGATSKRVIIPSYFRPQYLRTGGATSLTWFSDSNSAKRSMRPHADHFCVDGTGAKISVSGVDQKRFVNSTENYRALGLTRPFQFTPAESSASSTTTGSLGAWTTNSTDPLDIDLDVDTDGDGVMDAILMDLGYPPIRRGDGKLVVPLFAISIRDLNGLLNFNATGNLAGNTSLSGISATKQFGFRGNGPGIYVPDSLSKSNLGLSTYEINIQRALTANPATDSTLPGSDAARQLSYFLQQFDLSINTATVPQPGRSVSELANLEWFLLNVGRSQYHLGFAPTAPALQNAISTVFSGRLGESQQLRKFLTTFTATDLPKPGLYLTDDNSNFNEGESNPNTRWVQPLDFRGSGQQFRRFGLGTDQLPGGPGVDDDGNGIVDDLSEEGIAGPGSDDPVTPLFGKQPELFRTPGNLHLWPMFSGYHSAGTVVWGDGSTTGNVFASKLMIGSRPDDLIDEPTEAIIDPALINPLYSGSAALSTVIKQDAVFGPEEMQFLQGTDSDVQQSEFRSRLGELMPGNLVASQFAAAIRKRFTTVSADRREYGVGTSGIGTIRAWETNPQFPPTLAAGSGNPYRDDLFTLLRQNGTPGIANKQFRLNLNRLFVLNGAQYEFRTLTEYTPNTAPSAAANVNANLDRQSMARDIYSLLYTLCQGNDADYRTTTLTAALAREMAQFAVNVVDELDTDDVITAFAYDSDLGDGWSVPDTVVYGVERQQLAFSETLAFRVAASAINSKMTIFDDTKTTADGRRYVYFELQNVTPFNVPLSTSTASSPTTATWRVSLLNSAGTVKSTVYFLAGAKSVANTTLIPDPVTTAPVLPPGAVFTVSSQDGTDTVSTGGNDYRTSDFRADTDDPPTGSGYERIVPTLGPAEATPPTDTTAATSFPPPACNLDLTFVGASYQTNAYLVTTNGSLLTAAQGSFAAVLDAATDTFQLVLERQTSDGTWAVVDRTKTPSGPNVAVLTPPATVLTDTNASIVAELAKISSSERVIPLNRASEVAVLPKLPRETFAQITFANPMALPMLWQHHNDRDFGTIAELFQIPLYGPDRLTDGRLGDREFVDRSTLDTSAGNDLIYPIATNLTYIPTIAAARFLKPHNPDQTGSSGNRWYRLLEFLEVPNRSHQYPVISFQSKNATLGSGFIAEPYNLPFGFGWPRIHGQLNLNMIRHPQVLAALLDDDLLINAGTDLLPGMDENTRNWWLEFVKARDSRSTTTPLAFGPDSATSLYVPGTATSRPFRSLDAVGANNGTIVTGDSPIENTILRSLPMDSALGTNSEEYRRLFEVGMASEHAGTPVGESSVTPLHPSARYRLLSKLMNNTTTRSNSFAIFLSVQYHEAVDTSQGGTAAIRVGGRLEDTPVHRGFFVVDRTGAIEQMKALGSIPTSGNSFSHRADTARTGTPNGIRWKDLVLYRQTLN